LLTWVFKVDTSFDEEAPAAVVAVAVAQAMAVHAAALATVFFLFLDRVHRLIVHGLFVFITRFSVLTLTIHFLVFTVLKEKSETGFAEKTLQNVDFQVLVVVFSAVFHTLEIQLTTGFTAVSTAHTIQIPAATGIFNIFWYRFLSGEKQSTILFLVVFIVFSISSKTPDTVFTLSDTNKVHVCKTLHGALATFPTQFQKVLSFSAITNL